MDGDPVSIDREGGLAPFEAGGQVGVVTRNGDRAAPDRAPETGRIADEVESASAPLVDIVRGAPLEVVEEIVTWGRVAEGKMKRAVVGKVRLIVPENGTGAAFESGNPARGL